MRFLSSLGGALARASKFIRRDKKAAAGAARFVLLEEVGRPATGVVVPPELQSEVVAWLIGR